MSSIGIAELTALGAAPASGDLLVVVDISDTGQSLAGSTKNMTVANLFTSPTMTGTVTAAALNLSGNLAIATNKFTVAAASGNTVVAGTLVTSGIITAAGTASGTSGDKASQNILLYSATATNWAGIQANVNGDAVISVGNPTNRFSTVFAVAGPITAPSTLTATRLIGGTDISGASAPLVFGDGTAGQPTVGFTPLSSILGAQSSVASVNASGDFLNTHVQSKQSVATTGSIQGLETWNWLAHTSGTVVNSFGLLGNTSVSGVGGTTTTARSVTGGGNVTGGTVTDFRCVTAGGVTVTGGSSVVTNLAGVHVSNPTTASGGTIGTVTAVDLLAMAAGTTNWALRTRINDSTFNGSGAAVATNAVTGFLYVPTCAGPPTGVPSNVATGHVPLIFDVTNNFLYFYNSGWKKSTVYA